MSPSRYDAFEDPYCYPGTNCLINRLDIRDEARLEEFELEMSTLRAEEPLPLGRLSPTHYCRIHHHLFQDVYDWAGKYRTVGTSKGGNRFCVPERIPQEMRRVFGRLSGPVFRGGHAKEEFALNAAEFLGDLNALHPFREGNGRAQLALMHLIGLRAGHRLRLEAIQRETFLPAMIASFHGEMERLTQEIRDLAI